MLFVLSLDLLHIFFCLVYSMVIDQCLFNFADAVVSIWVVTNDWLQTAGVNTMVLSDDTDILLLAFVFGNNHIGRGVMLLIAHKDMRHKRTLTWKE